MDHARAGVVAWVASFAYLFAPLMGGSLVLGFCHRFSLARTLARPIDAGANLSRRRILGDGKTWRGLLAFPLGTAPVFWLQANGLHDVRGLRELELFDYGAIAHAWAVGLGLGAAAMLAELPNSFIKRRVGIRSGHPATRWRALAHFVDQVDLLVGFYLVLACLVPLDGRVVATSVVFFYVAHQGATIAAHALGMRRSPR